MPPLLAPKGGPVWADRDLPAHRTLLTSRSVEFDAIVVTALVPPAADARQSRDAKAGAGATTAVDPRLTLLVDEAFRHGKGIGVVGTPARRGSGARRRRGRRHRGRCRGRGHRTVAGLAEHRAWNRFTPTR